MSIEGQGHFFTIYFPGFVCFVLYLAKISGERLQDHWSSGFKWAWPVNLRLRQVKSCCRGFIRPVEFCCKKVNQKSLFSSFWLKTLVVNCHAFDQVRSAKRPIKMIIGKLSTPNHFIYWLHVYYLCAYMLDNMICYC